MYYEFPSLPSGWYHGENHSNNVYSAAQIHQVCQLLENPYITLKFIAEYTGVGKDTVWRIQEGQYWKDIAADYKIVGRSNRKSDLIIDLYNQGVTRPDITTIIMTEFDLPDRRKVNLSVGDIINRYKRKIPGSTTIDQLRDTRNTFTM